MIEVEVNFFTSPSFSLSCGRKLVEIFENQDFFRGFQDCRRIAARQCAHSRLFVSTCPAVLSRRSFVRKRKPRAQWMRVKSET